MSAMQETPPRPDVEPAQRPRWEKYCSRIMQYLGMPLIFLVGISSLPGLAVVFKAGLMAMGPDLSSQFPAWYLPWVGLHHVMGLGWLACVIVYEGAVLIRMTASRRPMFGPWFG